MKKTTKEILKNIYKKRPVNVRKYDYGLLLVIGGSEFYSGSPALNALAAFRAGVDMVQVIAPKRTADIVASFSPNLAAFSLEEKCLTKQSLSTLMLMTDSAKIISPSKTAVVIGGGVGRSKETQEAICQYLSQLSIPAVIDADAIHALAKNPKIIFNKPFLLTPHSYEFFILSGKKVNGLSLQEKIKAIEEEAKRLGTTILLKGEVDIISNGRKTILNETGSPYMTVGGTGDTLAGICGSIMAQGFDPFLAAQAGAFINGRAGALAAKEKKEGLLATDLIEAIPRVLH